jgi:hypothetical protein
MHLWITGRIVETMHHEARDRATHSRARRELRDPAKNGERRRERWTAPWRAR